jgi:hypothetical protein
MFLGLKKSLKVQSMPLTIGHVKIEDLKNKTPQVLH